MREEFLIGIAGVFIGSILTFFINWIILKRGKRLEAYGNINRSLTNFYDNINKFIQKYYKRFDKIEEYNKSEEYISIKFSLNQLKQEVYSNSYILPEKVGNKLLASIEKTRNILNKKFDMKKIEKGINEIVEILELDSKKWF